MLAEISLFYERMRQEASRREPGLDTRAVNETAPSLLPAGTRMNSFAAADVEAFIA